ncbi:MAG: hypothetical protein E6Z60_15475, partial [Mixta calida]|nr:hypothetical protein [Mixta calida]
LYGSPLPSIRCWHCNAAPSGPPRAGFLTPVCFAVFPLSFPAVLCFFRLLNHQKIYKTVTALT